MFLNNVLEDNISLLQKNQFNRAVQAKRQPGSSFKPFVYLTALEKGFKPTDIFNDTPTTIENWTPRNHDDKYIHTYFYEIVCILPIQRHYKFIEYMVYFE